MPTIETCFNCFGTCSSDANRKKRTTKPPGEISKVSRPPPSPWRERGSCQDGTSAWRINFLACHTRPVGKKLYSLLIVSILNNLQWYTIQDTGQDRYNRYSPVPNRYTIHQSIPLVLSVYQDQSMQGEGKRRFFPHTGTGAKGEEVSGFHYLSI